MSAGAEIVIYASATVVAAVVVYLGRKLIAALNELLKMAHDWRGTPGRPGVPAVPGVMERLQSGDHRFDQIDARLDAVVAELPKNGIPLAEKIHRLYKAAGLDETKH